MKFKLCRYFLQASLVLPSAKLAIPKKLIILLDLFKTVGAKMEIGIVGLPYSGKSTLFKTLLKHKSSDLSGGRQSAERGIVKVPDERLDRLTGMFNP